MNLKVREFIDNLIFLEVINIIDNTLYIFTEFGYVHSYGHVCS